MSMHRSSRAGLLVLAVGAVAMLGLSQCGKNPSASPDSTIAPSAESTVESTSQSTSAATSSLTTPSSVAPSTLAPSTVVAPTAPAAPAPGCTATGSSAGVDRAAQRAWLCEGGVVAATFPITSAWTMPDPGAYPIYAKDLHAASNFGGHHSTMTHFIAFSYGKNTGARVAFHSVPVLADGEFVQPLASVGDLGRRGESSGCIRVLPDDAVMLWDALDIGDVVTVLT